jgi:hypothetical protein
VAFLIVIPDHGDTGAAVVSCCSYVASSLLAAFLFLHHRSGSVRAALVPRAEDLRDYARLSKRAWAEVGRRLSSSQ